MAPQRIAPRPYPAPYSFLSNYGCYSQLEQVGEYEQQMFTTVEWCEDHTGTAILDGEGNRIGTTPWKHAAFGYPLPYHPDAVNYAKTKYPYPSPDLYDWVLLGDYADTFRHEVMGTLESVSVAAGKPGFNWSGYLAQAAKRWTAENPTIRLYQHFEVPAMLPVVYVLEAAAKDDPIWNKYIPAIGPGSDAWNQSVAVTQARLAQRQANKKAVATTAAVGVAAFVAAALAPTVLSSIGASAGSTATVSGAELAALVESGTVGAQGAFLEAAALTGSTVTYSTTTGAIIGAVTPTGTQIGFDAAADPFTQFNIEPSSITIEPPSPTDMPDALEIAENAPSPNQPVNVEPPPDGGLLDQAKDAAIAAAEQQAKAFAMQELQSLLQDDPAAAGPALAPRAQGSNMGPLIALALVGGAIVMRQSRKPNRKR